MSWLNLLEKYRQGEKLACLTAYDASLAQVMHQAGVDLMLVGDSLGMVLQGHKDTLAVTTQQMVYHTANVRRGCADALIVSDMPFLSHYDSQQAIKNAGQLMAEGGADMIKIEGGIHNADIIHSVVQEFIPVCGHIGLRPQQVRQLGGFLRQGETELQKKAIYKDAQALVEAGCCMLLLECIEDGLAAKITAEFEVPTIGIGSGKNCSGQILVCYDVLGIGKLKPWFSKDFLQGNNSVFLAFQRYVEAVKQQHFPS